MNETTITLIGNLADEPELRFVASGAAVVKFRVASTPRFFDKAAGEYKDGEPLFPPCQAWRDQAEHIAESLTRGMRVIVVGRLRQRSYETREGEKRTVFEVEVDEVGPALRYATAKVEKTSRSGGGRTAATRTPEPTPDPWSTSSTAPGQSRTTRSVVGEPGDGTDEPPW